MSPVTRLNRLFLDKLNVKPATAMAG